jgi:ABC-type sugar transport system ATPase subunit
VAVVHQEFSLLPALTVAENVFIGHEPKRYGFLDRRRMLDETADLLARLGSAIAPDVPVELLSVASMQIVEVAKALSIEADVVAMDEPSAVLSGPELEQLFAVVRALQREGVAVLYVSHRLDEVFRLCDHYTVLKDGRVSGRGAIADVTHDELVTMMVGRDVSQVFPRAADAPGPPRLVARDLDVRGLPAPITMEARAGEIVGLVGLNGAGRTRLAKGLFGAIPARGEIAIDGVARTAFRRPADAMRAGVAFIPEDRKIEGLALTKNVRSNISLNVVERVAGRLLSIAAEKRFAAKAIGDLGIRTRSDGSGSVGSLSGGNQQKAVLAKWLALDPKVLILDEPTRGIDVGSKEQIYALLRSLADNGTAVIVISSELVEALGLSDRILVMADGRIVGELPHDDASEELVLRMITRSSRHEVAVGAGQ